MNPFRQILILLAITSQLTYAAPQKAADLSLETAVVLKKTQEAKLEAKEGVANPVVSVETHHGKDDAGNMQITVSKVTYADDTKVELVASSKSALANIIRMPGVANPVQAMADAKISGMDAKRLSFVCDRLDKKVGIEAAYFVKGQILYTVQVVFVHSDEARAKAEAVLATVKLGE